MNLNRLIERLKIEEGFNRHAYKDHLGFWTIGFGRLIDERKGGGITEAEGEYLLRNDVENVAVELPPKLPFWADLNDTRQNALLEMAFQMGVPTLMQFNNMILALGVGDFETAAGEALDSRWARQTPKRARRVAAMIRHGEEPEA